ncbi:MAG TPA: hypothetical protein VHB70_18100, partial [Parafilimonas sp.]|nr:hypothetical protein [Parafilimonas sp.]
MKPKLLSLTLTFLCLQLQTKMYAQCPSLNQPISCINATTALNRINAFQRFEKTILQSNGITVTDFAISSIAQLETILQNFASDATAYDGIRIYFAVSGPISEAGFDANTLYLILVPTLKTSIVDANGDTVSDDDENDAFVITNGNIIQKSFCTDLFLREWINRYIYLIAPKIEQ